MSEPAAFRLPLTHYPGMNRFVLDWLPNEVRATRFLKREMWSANLASRPSDSSLREGRAPLAEALKQSNQHWGVFAGAPLDAWASGESVTIVAGQQVGFAGGPLYTLAKVASLVRMKRELEANGIPATAFFWLATEDHDFEEVATLNVPVALLGGEKEINRQLDLVCIRAIRAADGRTVVGSLPVPSALTTNLLALFDIDRPNWLREGITFRDSFAELIGSMFGNDVILVDALLPELRQAGGSLFEQIVRRGDEIQKSIAGRSEELSTSGYAQQVVPREGDAYTLLFEIDETGERRALEPGKLPPAEKISTSALTRPLLQDYVLRPDVFVGGPAEVAYYAQIAPLHDLLGISMPRVALRGHALVAPKRVARAITRYGIDPCHVFATPEEILAEREPVAVARIRALSEEAKRDLLARIEAIGDLALPADHSLAGAVEKTIGHIEFHFGKLTHRATKAVLRKDRERFTATRELVATLFPDRHVQDRVVSWFAWWSRYGQLLIDRLVEEIEPDSDSFKIVTL